MDVVLPYFFSLTLWLYAVSTLIYFVYFSIKRSFFREPSWICWSWRSLFISWLILTVYILLRWTATGHPPVMYQFENALLGTWVLNVIFFIFGSRYNNLKGTGILIAPLSALMLGYGLSGGSALLPISPPFKSNWLWLHVGFAWIAYGSFVLAAIASFFYLLKGERRLLWLPDPSKLEDIILMLVILGFITQTVQIASGAIWARILWGRFWSWDPVETWSLLVWMVYGLIIHFYFSFSWKGRVFVLLTIFALLFEIVCFGGIGFIPAPHTPLLWRNLF